MFSEESSKDVICALRPVRKLISVKTPKPELNFEGTVLHHRCQLGLQLRTSLNCQNSLAGWKKRLVMSTLCVSIKMWYSSLYFVLSLLLLPLVLFFPYVYCC